MKGIREIDITHSNNDRIIIYRLDNVVGSHKARRIHPYITGYEQPIPLFGLFLIKDPLLKYNARLVQYESLRKEQLMKRSFCFGASESNHRKFV